MLEKQHMSTQANQAQTGNAALIAELKKGGYAVSPEGYWKARGYVDFPGWEHLPFADFFENLSESQGKGHKKMWLTPDGKMRQDRTSFECDTLMPLYDGIQQTLRTIVSNGFFMYSALVVSMHLNLAYYGKKFGCSADVLSVMEAGDAKAKKDIEDRALAARICAYIIYEGDGLGGYADKVWPLWGRITGKACPVTESVLNQTEATAAKAEWDKASDEERKQLFYTWWMMIDCPAHKGISRSIIEKIYVAFKTVRRYQQMENPFCPEELRFNPENKSDRQAAITGFFRRAAIGVGEARAYDANELDAPANRFCDMLDDARADVTAMLTGHGGKLTPFGEQIMITLDLHLRRNDIVDTIVARQEDDENTRNENRKNGLAERVSKRGRARLR